MSCDAFTQSAERATFEMRTSSMLPGKEFCPAPPPSLSVAQPARSVLVLALVAFASEPPSKYQICFPVVLTRVYA